MHTEVSKLQANKPCQLSAPQKDLYHSSLRFPPTPPFPLPPLCLSLLLNSRLRAPLLSLRIIMLQPHLLLLFPIPRDSGHDSSSRALDAVLHARTEV